MRTGVFDDSIHKAYGGKNPFTIAQKTLYDWAGGARHSVFTRWQVPVGWYSIDERLFRGYLQRSVIEGTAPLVLDCLGRPSDILRLDELAYYIERAWLAEWAAIEADVKGRSREHGSIDDGPSGRNRSPKPVRPGLVLRRADGMVVLAADINRTMRPSLSSLVAHTWITTQDLVAFGPDYGAAATKRSQAFHALLQQGLLIAEADTKPPGMTTHTRLKRYASVAGIVRFAPAPAAARIRTSEIDWMTIEPVTRKEAERFWSDTETLADRLRKVGLTSL